MSQPTQRIRVLALIGLTMCMVPQLWADEEGQNGRQDQGKPGSETGSRQQLETASLTGPMQSATTLFGNLKLKSTFDSSLQSSHQDIVEAGPVVANSTFCWAAPNFSHQPLIFEQPYLERFGVGPHRALQPWTAGLHFYSRIPLLPLTILKHPPSSHEYSLGYRRPGDCVTELPVGRALAP